MDNTLDEAKRNAKYYRERNKIRVTSDDMEKKGEDQRERKKERK